MRGSSGKAASLGMFEGSSPIPVFPEGCPAPGGHPRAVTEWDTGTFFPPKLLSALGAETSGIFGCWGGVVQDAPACSQPLPNIPGTGMRIPKCRTCLTALRDGRCHIDVPDTALTSSTAGNVGIAAADPRRIRVPNPCSRFATSFCILLLIFALFTLFRT